MLYAKPVMLGGLGYQIVSFWSPGQGFGVGLKEGFKRVVYKAKRVAITASTRSTKVSKP